MSITKDKNGKWMSQIHKKETRLPNEKRSPCHKAGCMGKKNADEMLFWTTEEFAASIEAVKDKPASYAIFMTLYCTDIREGELLARTPADTDPNKSTLRISKSDQWLGGENVMTSPKMPKSNRMITIPEKLCDCLRVYRGSAMDCRTTTGCSPTPNTFWQLDRLMPES